MVRGAKKTSIKPKKEKQKMVLAKDPKQLAMAGIIILLFLANSIYMLVKYVQEQNPPPLTTAQKEQMKNMTPAQFAKTGPNGQPIGNQGQPSPDGKTQATQAPTKVQSVQTPPPAESGINPLIPIIILLVVAGLGYALYKYTKSMEPEPHSKGKAKKGKGNGKTKGKEKFMLAKDPKQLVMAAVVLLLFVANSIYMAVKYFQEQNPQAPVSSQNNSPQTMAEKMAQQQQQNLQSLEKGGVTPNQNIAQDANNIYSQTVNLKAPEQAVKNEGQRLVKDVENEVEILPKKKARQNNGKMVTIAVDNSGRSNPFLPASENYVQSTSSLPFLPPPPETLQSDSDAGKVMTTVISGILYDKYSPSAIINIEGTDYLVKRGDVVNRYKVLSIDKTQVLVQLGKNVYKAGVGELLSITNLNFNTIANLNKKFGGNDVSINVKKKGY